MRLRHLLTFLALWPAATASAQWLPAGPTSGSPNFFARNSRFVFAADDDGFVYRSTTDGRTWTSVNPTLPTTSNANGRLVGLAAHEGAVAVLERTGFYRSLNDGQTWARTGGLPTTATSPVGLWSTRGGAFVTTVIASSTPRLAVSTDGGATWAVRDSVLRGTQNIVIAVGDTLVRPYERPYRQPSGAFATECGAAISADLGVSWTFRPLSPDCFGGFPGALAGSPGLAYDAGRLYLGGVYVSSDFGLTWSQMPGSPSVFVTALAAKGDAVVACGQAVSRCGSLRAKPAGGTWRDPITGPPSRLAASNLFSTGTSFLLGLDQAGAYRSEDGVTWAPTGRFTHNSDVLALARHGNVLVAGSGLARFLRSYDRGQTWQLDYLTVGAGEDPAALFSADSVLLAGGAAGVYKSRDLKTWTRIATAPTNVKGFFRAGGRTYLAATGGLYTTTNAGAAWTQVLNHNLNQVDVGLAGDRVIVNGGNGSVRSARWSLDAGLTWSAASKNALVVATTRQAFFAASQNFALFGGGTFERSLDNGQTWVDLKPLLGEDIAPSLLENYGDTLLAIGPTYFAASLDHGATWRKVPHPGLPFVHSAGSAVSLPRSMLRVQDSVYVAFAGAGVWKRSLADLGLATAVEPGHAAEAERLAVTPNPASGGVRLRYTLAQPGRVRLTLHDGLGREVAQVLDAEEGAGRHEVAWDAAALAPGRYFVRLTGAHGVQTQVLVRVR